MKRLKATTCQWQGLKLIIYGTRFISEDHLITYRKGSFQVPKDETHAATFAHLLTAVVFLRRLVYLNYTKLNITLGAKYTREIETMHFSPDGDFNFRPDSTAGLENQDILQNIDTQTSCPIDTEMESQIIRSMSKIKPEADVVAFKD